jgi:ATP-dependent RNA helicase DDX19/DBP5
VDPKIPKTQVLVLCHIRELSQQIAEVYEKITKFTDITVCNYTATGKANDAHIVVTTLGMLKNALNNRTKVLDLSAMRVLVIDEVDFFFSGSEDNSRTLYDLHNKYLSKLPKFQWVLFSATYPPATLDSIYEFCKEAAAIQLKKEKLHLDHIQQYQYRCEPKKKIEFIMDVFNTCSLTQAIIFVNTRKFCEFVQNTLRKNNYKSTIMFGDMSNEEREQVMAKFRKCEVNVIITTNMLARGIDVPEIEIVINFDVPTLTPANGDRRGDPESYIHRIGRTGRFGSKGIAVTIYDKDEDKTYLD